MAIGSAESISFLIIDQVFTIILAEQTHIVHIRITLSLEELNISRAYEQEIETREDLEIIDQWKPLAFGAD